MVSGRTLNIERILNEVERERRKRLVLRLVEEGLNYEPNNDRYYFVRQRTALAFDVLTCVMPDKAVDIIESEMGKNFQDHRADLILASLPLALLKPDKAVKLYENALGDWLETIRMQAAQAIPLLIISRPDDAVRLYKKALEPEGYEFERAKVFMAAAGSLSGIAGFYATCENPPRALAENPEFMELSGLDQKTKRAMEVISAFYKRLAEDHSEIVEDEKQVVNGIRKIVSNKQNLLFASIKEKELKNVNITKIELENIIGNTEFNAHMFLAEAFNTRNIWEEQQEKLPLDIAEIKDITRQEPLRKDTDITDRTNLKSLLLTSPNRLLEFYNDNIRNSNKVTNDKVKHALRCIIATMADDKLTPIEDEEYEFIKQYLESKYVYTNPNEKKELRTEYEMVSELEKLVQDSDKNHSKMKKILEHGKARDLKEIELCSQFDAPEIFLRKLGKGTKGETYLVHSDEFGKEMAMKVIKYGFYSDTEVKILSDLQHPNIVRIWYASKKIVKTDDTYHYAILMDYVDGKTMKEIMEENSSGIDTEKATDYSGQLLEGIAYLRRKGVFHRDIHPNNVKVDSTETVKIIDFGIAITDPEAPPQDNRRYGGSTDLFSWGLITYELLTGEHIILKRTEKMGSHTHAERINELKVAMRHSNGMLKKEYRNKIREKIPEHLQESLLISLGNALQPDNQDILTKIRSNYMSLRVDQAKKSELEKTLGKPITEEEYLKISDILKK